MNNNNFPLQEISIKELYMPANECIYEIPIYQRNYAWEQDEITTLIQDVFDKYTNNPNANYYIGTLVSYKKADNVYEIIDGQQRLTTIRIILGVMYTLEKFNKNGNLGPLKSRLTFRARDKSDEALKHIPSNSEEERDKKRIRTTSIDEGFEYAREKLLKISNDIVNIKNSHEKDDSQINRDDLSISNFVDFFLNKVHIIHYQVPADIDLNHYFEIMNSRGEQLEKHEIVKAKIIEIFSDDNDQSNNHQRQFVNEIWNACSQMNVYIQSVLHKQKISKITNDNSNDKPSYAGVIFGDDFNSYNVITSEGKSEFDEIVKQIFPSDNINKEENKKLSLQDILDHKYDAAEVINVKKEYVPSSFQPIIDFSNFLLIVLKITEYQEKTQSQNSEIRDDNGKIHLATLDDKELLNAFDSYLKSDLDSKKRKSRAERFIINLLKARYFLDNFVVHHNLETEQLNSNPWDLKKYCKSKNDFETKNLVANLDKSSGDEQGVDEQGVQDELCQLLSMFEVTYSARQRKNYLFYCLYYLINKWNWDKSLDSYNSYLRFVRNLAYYYFHYIYLVDVETEQKKFESIEKSGNDKAENKEFRAADCLRQSFDAVILDKLSEMDSTELKFITNNPPRSSTDFTEIYGNGEDKASRSEQCSDIPLFIFNYLDYKIWKCYYDNVRGEDNDKKKNDFYDLIGCPHPTLTTEPKNNRFYKFLDKFNNFYFSRSRKSLEHYLPQTNINSADVGGNDDKYDIIINCLGNYAMIGSRANSSGSNWDPQTKISHYLDMSQKIDPVSVSSLKFLIMMRICDGDEQKMWEKDQIQEHQKKMLNILFPGDNEQCHYPNNISLLSEHKDDYKSLRYDKIKDIFSRIKDHLKGQFNASDIKNFDFECEDRKYPQLKFNLRTYDDIVLSLCFEAACKRDESAYFYYGIVVEFVSDYSSDNYSYEAVTQKIQKRKKDIQNIFENKSWKEYVSAIPKRHSWVWWKRLPSKSNELNFNILNNYKKLFESSYYETILSEIFSEVDTNLEFIMDNGIPNDLSEVESDTDY